MKRLFGWLRYPAVVLTVLLITAGYANRVPSLSVPEGVIKRTEKVVLQGRQTLVDFYLPQNAEKAPVVIVAHGFSRHRRVMAGWGGLLAQHGMIAVVPSLPALTDQGVNIRAMGELIELVHESGHITRPSPTGDVALIGHSAGGFGTLIAASREKRARCWIGLDPVDFNARGLLAAKSLRIPGLMLLAESGAWNRHANALPWVKAGSVSLTALRIRNSTHCDPENPTSTLARVVCGATDDARRAVYERYALAMLKQHLFDDAAAAELMRGSAQDAAVSVLSTHAAAKEE